MGVRQLRPRPLAKISASFLHYGKVTLPSSSLRKKVKKMYCPNPACANFAPCNHQATYCPSPDCERWTPCTVHIDEGERLFQQLNALFASDPDIDEFGLVVDTTASVYQPTKTSKPSSPGPFMLVEHKLGVTYACVPILLRHATKRFRQICRQWDTAQAELLDLTRVMLLVNADNYTAWNNRKKVLEPMLRSESVVQQELKFLDLLFSKHPKSGEAWAHRRWVLDRAMSMEKGSWSKLRETAEAKAPTVRFQEKWLQRELAVCSRSSELYPKNYYAWTHRHWVVSKLEDSKDVLLALTKSRKWTDVNVGDNCGFNHRQVLLSSFAALTHLPNSDASSLSNCEACSTWTTEFEYVSKLQEFYAGHETLWLHRRFLVRTFSSILLQHHVADFTVLLQSEIEFTKAALENKEVEGHKENQRFAAAYGLWLTFLTQTPPELAEQLSTWRKALSELLISIWGTATQLWPTLPELSTLHSSPSGTPKFRVSEV